MKLETPQLMLSFEPDDSRESRVTLRVSRSVREYFESTARNESSYPISLPQPFKETAFMDSGGWRKHPRDGFSAADLGFRMYTRLPSALDHALRAQMIQGGDTQRVCIVSRSAGIDDVPWEWLNAGPGIVPFAVHDRFRFVRLVPTLYGAPPLTVEPPVRVLVILTNPKDERVLYAPEELRIVTSGLQSNAHYEVTYLNQPRLENLHQALHGLPHVVHYVGHAGLTGQNGALILHDTQEGTHWVSAAELARILPSSVRLLCLSTCVTTENYKISGLLHIAHSPAELPLPTTIVNQYALQPQAAETFWRTFYPQLIQSEGDVVEAFHRSRAAVYAMALPTWCWASFSLVIRDGTGHPLRLAHEGMPGAERRAAEIQAQWSARLANTLAVRMQSLAPEARDLIEHSLSDEDARIDALHARIEKL